MMTTFRTLSATYHPPFAGSYATIVSFESAIRSRWPNAKGLLSMYVTATPLEPYASARGLKGRVTVATTELLASEITLTVPEPEFATNTSPIAGSYATAIGLEPTEIVVKTVSVASTITLTLLEPQHVTNTSLVPESYASPNGMQPPPRLTVATTWFVASLMTLTSFDPLSATNTSFKLESYARPQGPEPTDTVATTVPVASAITLTLFEFPFATNSSRFPESYAIPSGPEPTDTVLTNANGSSDEERVEPENPGSLGCPAPRTGATPPTTIAIAMIPNSKRPTTEVPNGLRRFEPDRCNSPRRGAMRRGSFVSS